MSKQQKKRSRQKQVDPVDNLPGAVLTRLVGDIKLQLNIDYARLITMIDTYVLKLNQGKENTVTQYTRNNLKDRLTDKKMTFPAFCTFLAVLEASNFKITVDVKLPDGRTVTSEDITHLKTDNLIKVNVKEKENE